MKKLIVFLSLILLFNIGNIFAQKSYIVKGQKLNVRSTPSTSGKIVGSLRYGDKIEVESIDKGWARFFYKKRNAYVSTSYIELIEQEHPISIYSNSEETDISKKETVIDYSLYSTSVQVQDSIYSNVGDPKYYDVEPGFVAVKYDNIKIQDSETVFHGISVGLLSNPLDRENKRSSWTMQCGAFVDYYWSTIKADYANMNMHYFGISPILHLLGWQFSDGKGNGFAIHGGFEFTLRIAGSGSVGLEGMGSKSFSPFSKDDMGDGRLKHFACGFAGAADFVYSNLYASVGYKLITPIIKDTNCFGFYVALGYSF